MWQWKRDWEHQQTDVKFRTKKSPFPFTSSLNPWLVFCYIFWVLYGQKNQTSLMGEIALALWAIASSIIFHSKNLSHLLSNFFRQNYFQYSNLIAGIRHYLLKTISNNFQFICPHTLMQKRKLSPKFFTQLCYASKKCFIFQDTAQVFIKM